MILLIGGTSETAPLASGLAAAGYEVLVSTATAEPLAIGESPRISRRTGRLDEEGLAALGRERGIRAIADAAHPYAVAAHAAAGNAARRLGIPCLVLRRPETLTPDDDRHGAASPAYEAPARAEGSPASPAENRASLGAGGGKAPGSAVRFAASHTEAAAMAFALGPPVLLTTGSRNLAPYAEASLRTGVPFAVRVLDTPESLAACRTAGIPEERIIAGRGPFSVEQNLDAIRRFGIGVIVTKESGLAGGFDTKLAAARRADCRLIVLSRPETPDTGLTFGDPAALIAVLRDLVPARTSSPFPL